MIHFNILIKYQLHYEKLFINGHIYQETSDSTHIYAIVLLEELFQCNSIKLMPLPTLSAEDQEFLQEIIDSREEVTANLANNIKNIIISNQ